MLTIRNNQDKNDSISLNHPPLGYRRPRSLSSSSSNSHSSLRPVVAVKLRETTPRPVSLTHVSTPTSAKSRFSGLRVSLDRLVIKPQDKLPGLSSIIHQVKPGRVSATPISEDRDDPTSHLVLHDLTETVLPPSAFVEDNVDKIRNLRSSTIHKNIYIESPGSDTELSDHRDEEGPPKKCLNTSSTKRCLPVAGGRTRHFFSKPATEAFHRLHLICINASIKHIKDMINNLSEPDQIQIRQFPDKVIQLKIKTLLINARKKY